MPDRAAVIYTYDGSFEGVLSCVFESYRRHEVPLDIEPEYDSVLSLCPQVYIPADSEKAGRVDRGVLSKMGRSAENMLRTGFLYGGDGKETAMLDFIRFGLSEGFGCTASLIDRPEVSPLFRMCRAVGNEAHMLKGFTRFTDCGGALSAVISPKHYVLPLLRGHFTMRYRNENFLIFDKTHRAALIHSGGRTAVVPVRSLSIPDSAESGNGMYQRLWKEYYKNAEIAQRSNHRCRMAHMPRRFWPNMLEVSGELQSLGNG